MALQVFDNKEQVNRIAAYFSQNRVKKVIVRRDIKGDYEIDFYTSRDTAFTQMLFKYDLRYLTRNFGLKL